MDSDIEKAIFIAKEARSSISNYCINTCKAKCCKRGKLVLFNNAEIKAIVGLNKTKYYRDKILTINKATGNHHYDLEKKSCKNLDSKNLCGIHKDKNKPKICDDYPIFLSKKFIIVAKDCQAVQNNLLNSYIHKIEEFGYKKI